MNKKLLLLSTLFFSLIVSAQDFSNWGTDFWTGFGYNIRMADNEAALSLYIVAGEQPATVTVSIPGLLDPGFPKTVNVPANSSVEVTNFPVGDVADPNNGSGLPDSRLFYTGKSQRGIHIQSDVPVTVYMHTYGKDVAGASLVLPSNILSYEYRVLSSGGNTNSGNPHCFFFVVASEDSTLLEITPTADIADSVKVSGSFINSGAVVQHAAGIPFTVMLNKGEVYNCMGWIANGTGLDLTGSRIRAKDIHKKIAVFAGNGRIFLHSAGCLVSSGSDNFIQQMFPTIVWGSKYLTTPAKTMEYGLYKIGLKDTTTKVKVNGSILSNASLIGGSYYLVENNTPNLIESDKPVMIAQCVITPNCKTPASGNNGRGDPEMIILSPVGQETDHVNVFSIAKSTISTDGASFINVIIDTAGISSFKIDNLSKIDTGRNSYDNLDAYGAGDTVTIASAFRLHPTDNHYAYARFRVASGVAHTLSSNIGFNAIAYGFAPGESYGYTAGLNFKILTPLVYTFTGNGNWDNIDNWSNQSMPPSLLPIGSQIIIDPPNNGECVLNKPLTISPGGILTVLPGKKFVIQGNLLIQQ